MLTAEEIRQVRAGLDLSREGLADALLIRPDLVREWEAGRQSISLRFEELIEAHFGHPIQVLLERGKTSASLSIVDERGNGEHGGPTLRVPPKPWANRVLLVFPQPSNRNHYINTLPPLGILTIAGYLRARGIAVDVVDGQIQEETAWLPRVADYDVIGLSINTANVETAMRHIEAIKARTPKTLIVLGGPHALAAPEVFINHPHIDVVFVGEGERSFHEFLTTRDPNTVKGLYVKDAQNPSGFSFTGSRSWDTALDDLPFPSLDLVDVTKYRYYPKATTPISSIMTSRGCPQQCIFCFHNMGRKYRVRSAQHVVDEIQWQVESLGVRELSVYDDNFSLHRQRAMDIAQGVIDRKITVKLQFTNGLEACRLDRELIFKLRDAGTWFMAVAPETGDEESFKRIKKGFQLQRARDVVAWCKEAKIRTYAFFIVGFPWETESHLRHTTEFALQLDTDMVQFSRLLAFPKTEVYEQLLESGMPPFDPMKDRALFSGEIGHQVSALPQHVVLGYLKRGYRRFYLRPRKLVNLLRMMRTRDVLELARYALLTGNLY